MTLCSQIRFLVMSAVLLATSIGAAADTIVLKNGRRIVALSVFEEGDKVRYLTSAGELSLPKSIVDHIERGAGAVLANSSGAGAASLAIAPPAMQSGDWAGSEEVEHAAVHDGTVDRGYIAKLEGEARSGTQRASFSAAIAHRTAAWFEFSRGDTEHALADARTAVTYAPEDPVMLLGVAYLHLQKSEFKESLDYLVRARRFAPESADVAKLAGWAYYGLNKLDQAVAEWKRALALRPDPEVQKALDKALADKQEEESYKENESSHFKLRYSGASEPALARDVLRTLERHFSAVESDLNYTPPNPIGVILYTQDAFTDITKAPSWAGALNDGRIRVPVEGLTAVDQELSRVLKHELTHSFITQKTGSACMGGRSCANRAPTWLQEGLAQWREGQRSGENAAALVRVYEQGQALSPAQLEGSWTKMGGGTAHYAYAWSLANIEYIVHADGMGDVERILDRIGSGMPTEAALREVLHSDYNDLMRSTADYLRKAYGH